MAISTAYTLSEAKEMLAMWKEAEKALASGQAKYYKIGSREFKAVDLPDISERITHFSNVIEALNGNVRTKMVARIVPRDL